MLLKPFARMSSLYKVWSATVECNDGYHHTWVESKAVAKLILHTGNKAIACKAYPNYEAIPCDQFEVLFQGVELWLPDRVVLTVENSLGGNIHRNSDLLLCHRLQIVSKVQLSVHHCLLALPGIRKECLSRVISHPQALAQSAIANSRAAKLYGLNVVAHRIQDDCGNVTWFVKLAREPIIPRTDRPFKTNIVFTQDKGTSVLFKVPSAFAFRNINLTKIESKPHKNRAIKGFAFRVGLNHILLDGISSVGEGLVVTRYYRILEFYSTHTTERHPNSTEL
eukprot:Gb_16707 [translate_table: standard]